jgi:hypothetical protein
MTAPQHRSRPFLRSGRGGQRPDRSGQDHPPNLKAAIAARNPPETASQKQAKEVFEMAASLSIEEESGTYTARFSHPHNGYYAGDFSEPSRSGTELGTSYTERRDVPRLWQ